MFFSIGFPSLISGRYDFFVFITDFRVNFMKDISDRLSVAAAQAKHQHSKAKIQSLLAMF